MRSSSLRWILSLALLSITLLDAHGRSLLQGGPVCDSKAVWNISSCAAATGGLLGRRRLAVASSLPSRWATARAPDTESSLNGNPFADVRLVRTAQGGAVSGGSIGYTTGGAQDVANFRANLNASYLPLPSDVTFNGIIKDYYFDTTGETSQLCTELFCPIYSIGTSPQPALVQAADGPDSRTNASDLYMAVGLDSGIQADQFSRKKLNLVLLLDVSGSMDSPFNNYYYDQFGVQQNLTDEEQRKTKIQVAQEVLTGILDLLGPEDRVSIVLFSTDACQPLPLGKVGCLDVKALKADIERDVKATDSTNTGAGMKLAIKTLEECEACLSADPNEWENRIVLMTDAQTNEGAVEDSELKSILEDAAAKGIYFTIVGIGLDFQTTLVELITQVSGANYFSVHSPGEFQKLLVSQFNYSVTPLVFDLTLEIQSPLGLASEDGWRILQAYGSPNNDSTLTPDGKILSVKTLFPSPKEDAAIKGGVVLVRMLRPAAANTPLQLVASYRDRTAFVRKRPASNTTRTVPAGDLGATGPGASYQSSGVRKAILLARYTDLLRGWLVDQWQVASNATGPLPIPPTLCPGFPTLFCPGPQLEPLSFLASLSGQVRDCGLERWVAPRACIIPVPDVVIAPRLGEWERQSSPLKISADARRAFQEFLPYFQAEAAALADASLDQEVAVLEQLIALPVS
uniref:VWFA domain-containing protein n=2 Tax=Auxenochlorella protothecoides TaxID=3075 RepID=A0A1D2AAC0_AUXPR